MYLYSCGYLQMERSRSSPTLLNYTSPRIRWRLILFALGCMAVAIGVAGTGQFLEAHRERTQTEALLQRAVHDQAQHVEQQFAVATAILTTLSTSPALLYDDFSEFDHEARAVRRPPGSWFVLVPPAYESRTDQLINTRRPLGAPAQTEPATEATKDLVQRVVATRSVQLADLVYTPLTRGYVVGVGAPVMRGGEVVYVLMLALPEVAVRPALGGSLTGYAGVVDRAGQLLPGHNLPDQTTRQPPFENALLATAGAEGVIGGVVDGTPLYIAYARSDPTGWMVFYGIPRAALDAPIERAYLFVGIGLVVLLLAGVGIALLAEPGVILPLQRRIEEDNERVRVIADTVPSMLFTADRNGACDYVSERFYEYTGMALSAAEGFGWMDAVHPEDKAEILTGMVETPGTSTDVELRLRGKDGSYRWFAIRTSEINDAKGRLFGTATDIEALKQTEQVLHQLSLELMKSQDNERRRIARELHDTTVQSLAAAKIQIDQVRDGMVAPGAPSAAALGDADLLLEQSLSELRTLSYLLHPPMLDELGLAAAVRWYAQGFEKRSGVEVLVEAPDLPRLSADVEMALFRVVQEGLANVHRHSGSREARIGIRCHPEQIELEIADKGQGTADPIPDQGNYPLGVGIPGMRLRVQQLGGTLEFESGLAGFTLRVTVPLARVSAETSPAAAQSLKRA